MHVHASDLVALLLFLPRGSASRVLGRVHLDQGGDQELLPHGAGVLKPSARPAVDAEPAVHVSQPVRTGIGVPGFRPQMMVSPAESPRSSPNMSVATEALIDRALIAAKACSLAFVPISAMAREPYAAGLTCIGQVEDPQSLSGATLFTTSSKDIVIACRGSANAKNFQTNLDIGPAPLSIHCVDPAVQVHAGFQKAGAQLWERLQKLLPANAASHRLLVTGHSLGGGTATFIALHARAAGLQPELITIAGPRLGNHAFAQHYRQRCTIPAIHLLHDNDEVIKSNKGIWDDLGFENVGTVVRCDMETPCIFEDEAREPLCLVDDGLPSGSPSIKGIFVDHCRYMGYYIGVRLEHPSVWLRSPFS